MKELIFLLICNLTYAASKKSEDQRRAEIFKINDQERVELNRLNKQFKGSNPEIYVRLAELDLERARLLRDRENRDYLALPAARREASKQKIFAPSIKYFSDAKKTCEFVIRKFKNYPDEANVYYVAAYINKEFNNLSVAERYLTVSLKLSRPGDPIYDKAVLELADLKYNSKKFKEAVPLFEKGIGRMEDRWWTRYAHSLAWSYYQTGQKSRAISLMEEVKEKSGLKDYVDYFEQSFKDLIFFYTMTGGTDRAVALLKEAGRYNADELVIMANYLKGKGGDRGSEEILKMALSLRKKSEGKEVVLLNLITDYEQREDFDKHLEVATELFNLAKGGRLKKDQITALDYQLKKMGAILQKQLVSKRYNHDKKTLQVKSNQFLKYFTMLANLGVSSTDEIYLAIGEALYATENYNTALPYYKKSMDAALKSRNRKFYNLALNGLTVALESPKITAQNKDSYLVDAYMGYLMVNPQSKESYTIYQRLFNYYFEKKKYSNAEEVIVSFKKNYPKDSEKQEAMISKILDHYRKNKDRDNLMRWLARLNENEFAVSSNFKNKLNTVILTLQFDKVEGAGSTGDKKAALNGYRMIYQDPLSTEDAKKNSAYNIAVLFYELGDMANTFDWASRAMKMMNKDDVGRFQDSFMNMAEEMFNHGEFRSSAIMFAHVYNELCFTNSPNLTSAFRNAVAIALANDNQLMPVELLNTVSRCKVDENQILAARMDLLAVLKEKKMWVELDKMLLPMETDVKAVGQIIPYYWDLANAYKDAGRRDEENKIIAKIQQLYASAISKKQTLSIEALDIVASLRLPDVESRYRSFNGIVLAFPEEEYNKLLGQKIKMLDDLTTAVINLIKIGSGKALVRGYQYLTNAYTSMANELDRFTPSDRPPEYVESFKKNMTNISGPLRAKAKDYEQEAKQAIVKSNILSLDAYTFLSTAKYPIRLEYKYAHGGILMDRGGVR